MDGLLVKNEKIFLLEIKSGATLQTNFYSNILKLKNLFQNEFKKAWVVYAGSESKILHGIDILGWSQVEKIWREFNEN